jgi:hypothetical protein
MEWNNAVPSAPGRYRWREASGKRVHVVRVAIKRGVRTLACRTMDRAALEARGQWCVVDLAERTDALDGVLS